MTAGSTAPAPSTSASGPTTETTPAGPPIGTTATQNPVPVRGPVNVLRFRPGHGTQVAAAQGSDAVVWDVATAAEVTRLTGFPIGIGGLAFSPDGTLLAASGKTTDVWVWNVSERRRVAAIKVVESIGNLGIFDLAFTPDGRGLIVNSFGQLYRWDTATFTTRTTVADAGPGGAAFASFRLGGNGRIAIGNVSNFQTLHVWNLDANRLIKRIELPTYAIPAVQPNGTLVTIPGRDDVALWDAATQRQVGTVAARRSPTVGAWTSTEFSPDGRYLWTNGNGTTQLWNVSTRSSVATFTGMAGASGARFSSDSRYLAMVTYAGVLVWDLRAMLPAGG